MTVTVGHVGLVVVVGGHVSDSHQYVVGEGQLDDEVDAVEPDG